VNGQDATVLRPACDARLEHSEVSVVQRPHEFSLGWSKGPADRDFRGRRDCQEVSNLNTSISSIHAGFMALCVV